MTPTCPVCSGALGPGAQWCGLCYADLRPRVAAAPPDAPMPAGPTPDASVPVGPTPVAPLAQPPPPPTPPADSPAVVLLPLVDPPVPVGATGPGWPCSVCSSVVPYEADTCPVCGTGFLAALTGEGLPRLPLGGGAAGGPRRLLWVVAAILAVGLGLVLLLSVTLAARLPG